MQIDENGESLFFFFLKNEGTIYWPRLCTDVAIFLNLFPRSVSAD